MGPEGEANEKILEANEERIPSWSGGFVCCWLWLCHRQLRRLLQSVLRSLLSDSVLSWTCKLLPKAMQPLCAP